MQDSYLFKVGHNIIISNIEKQIKSKIHSYLLFSKA